MSEAAGEQTTVAAGELSADAQRRLAELTAERKALVVERDQHWSQVAETRAASIAAGELAGPLTYSDRRMQTLLADRGARLAEIERNRADRASLTAARERELTLAETQADHRQRLFDQAQAAFDAQLAGDKPYQHLARRAVDAQQAEAGLRERLIHAVDERDRKTRRYLSDPLFVYLRQRCFGRREYSGAGLRYRLDRWVAAVAGFEHAQQDFELLNDMPRWLQEKVDATARLAVEANETLTAYLERLPEIQPLREWQNGADNAACALASVQSSVEQAAESERQMDAEFEAAARHDDVCSREIRDLYRRAFSDQPIAALLKLAEQTGSDDDRQALRAIERIDRRVADIEQRIEQMCPSEVSDADDDDA